MDDRTAHVWMEFVNLSRSELDPEHAAEVEAQVRALPGGEDLLRQSRAFDSEIGRRLRDVPVPAGLRGRILDRLAARRAARWRRGLLQGLAAAAAVLLAVTLIWNWQYLSRPDLDAERLVHATEPQLRSPFEQAQAWLAEQGLHFAPEKPLDTTLLAAYETAEFQGRPVPMLLFINYREGVFARVYVVRSREFDLEAGAGEAHGSFGSVEVIADREEPHRIAYVAVYTGPTLEPFLVRSTTFS
ncbi:MAG TPA: hypothetical protein VIL46_18520 [Gemmataceae bacterium]